ncbi:MAK10-like protein [Tanacetum coccineum]
MIEWPSMGKEEVVSRSVKELRLLMLEWHDIGKEDEHVDTLNHASTSNVCPVVKHMNDENVGYLYCDNEEAFKGKAITCSKCGGTSHNERACTGPRDQQPTGKTKKHTRPEGLQDAKPIEVSRRSSQAMDSEPSGSQTRQIGSSSHGKDSQPNSSQKRKRATSSNGNLYQPSGSQTRKSARQATKLLHLGSIWRTYTIWTQFGKKWDKIATLLEDTQDLAYNSTAKLKNDILIFQQHQGESLSEAWTHFKDLLQKAPHHGIDLWLKVQIFYDHVNPATRRTIDQSAGDFAKPVKAISLTQDVPHTSNHHLIELENQVQRLMEAHLAPRSSVQVNKIAFSCEICSSPHDTQYCMENLEQTFVDYASSQTNEAGGKWFTFKPEQNNLGDAYNLSWKAINDRMTGALPSDTVKNPKLNVNPISSVLSARSYPMEDPQISSYLLNSVNAIKTRFKPTNNFQKDQLQVKTLTVNEIGTPKQKEQFLKLPHLNLPVLEVLAHAPIYNAILDKYVESLELGKNGSVFIQVEMRKKMKDPGLFTLPCRLGESKPFDTLADLGSLDGTKSYPAGIVKNVEVHIGKLKLLEDFYVIDTEKDPMTSLLVGRGFLATASAVIDCRKSKITVGEGITRYVIVKLWTRSGFDGDQRVVGVNAGLQSLE